MKYIKPNQDVWRNVGGDDGPMVTITPRAHLLLSLVQWHSIRRHWPAALPVGVRVPNDTDIESVADELPRLALVALDFPKWTDGRAYSQAHLLRARFRYGGEVLVDMLPLLARTGFDSAVLRADQDLTAAERALAFFPAHYQGDVREARPLFARTPAAEQAS